MITIKHAAMLSSVALSAFALPAMAQNAAAPQAADASLGEIVVTAQRRSER
jgi:outer membrane receptor protein involved in Fe transport